METSNDFKIDEAEERRRAGIPAIVRAILPHNLWENPLNWKRTKVAMGFAVMLITATGATAAVTVSKKATPTEGIQVASIVPMPSQQPAPQVKVSSPQPAAPKSSADANLPPYFRSVDSGEFCPDQDAKIKVMVENPDIVPGHPKLSELLKTSPCFNFGWFENDGKTVVINYIPHNSGILNSRHIEKDYELTKDNGAFRMYAAAVDPEFNRFMEALVLDATRRISGPNIENYYAKKMEELKKQGGNEANHYNYAFEIVFFDNLKRVARSEGLSVRLSDATREREACGKLPGDIRVPGGTGDCYKNVLARMNPIDWEKYFMKSGFAWFTYKDGNYDEAIKLYKEARSQLRLPQDLERADLDAKQTFPKIADQILSS